MPPTLSPAQRAAVAAPWRASPAVVLATAGSGKTLVLAARALRIAYDLLRGAATRPVRILCVCFNRSMADELHERLLSMNPPPHVVVTRSPRAVPSRVAIDVRTFHSLGLALLRRRTPAVRVVPRARLASLLFAELKRRGLLHVRDTERSARPRVAKLLAAFDLHKGASFDAVCVPHLHAATTSNDNLCTTTTRSSITEHRIADGLVNEYTAYRSVLSDQNAVDYGDMIMAAVQMLVSDARARSHVETMYDAVLCDEFQDVSASQLLLCTFLVRRSRAVTFVGDDDQQIYSWRTCRGSNDNSTPASSAGTGSASATDSSSSSGKTNEKVSKMMTWSPLEMIKVAFPCTRMLYLAENRRCSANIVRAASAVIANNGARHEKPIRAVNADAAPVQVVGCQSDDFEKAFLVQYVRRVLDERYGGRDKAAPSILMLFRTNELLAQFQQAFQDAGLKTTRKLHAARDAPPQAMGRLTFKVLACVTMVASDVDVDSFVWAVVSFSVAAAAAGRTYVHSILTEMERVENHGRSHRRSSSDSDSGSGSGSGSRHCGKRRQGERGDDKGVVASVYFDRLRRYVVAKKEGRRATSKHSDKVDALYNVVKAVDELMYETRALVTVRDIVARLAKVVGKSGSDSDAEDGDVTNLNSDLNEFCDMARHLLSHQTRSHTTTRTATSSSKSSASNDVGTVVFSTVHRAKGSTFDHVIVCGASMFHFPSSGTANGAYECVGIGVQGSQVVTAGMHQQQRRNEDAEYQEERRVFFVAQTRAVSHLMCTYSAQRRTQHSPPDQQSPFIMEMMRGVHHSDSNRNVEQSLIKQHSDIEAVCSKLATL